MPRTPGTFKIQDHTTFGDYREHFRNHEYPAFPDDITFLEAFGPQRLQQIFEPQLTPPGFALPQGCRCCDPARQDELATEMRKALAGEPSTVRFVPVRTVITSDPSRPEAINWASADPHRSLRRQLHRHLLS